MKSGLLPEILKSITSVKIAVIGDFCLDAYWFVDASKSEVSVETGQATRPVRNQKYSLGGAGNVANNLAAIGVKNIRAYGVIGTDPFGREMTGLMENTGINTDNILIQKEQWSTHVYIKPYIDDEEQNRIDFGNYNLLSDDIANQLINRLQNEVKSTDLVIINQQVLSGIHTDFLKNKLVGLINADPEKIFIADSRNYTDFYQGAYRKMNDNEASLLCGIRKEPDEMIPYSDVISNAKELYNRYRKPLLITRGSRGSLTIDEAGIKDIPGLMIISKVDSVGAGDSYLAGAAAVLAAGYPLETAAEIGSYVAGVTVQKLFQTGTASPAEILNIGTDPDYIYLPELAEDFRQARYHKNTEIEIIRDWPDKLCITHAIFDHDGTISTLREGWEQVMEPMMIRAILGDKFNEVNEDSFNKVRSGVRDFINKTTGLQTLMQMKMLLEIIKEFGFVTEDKMLDEYGYKEIYNNELMKVVKGREQKLIREELSVEDLTMKNALPFLKKLHGAGVRLYLASGTDEGDVKNEAVALGYDTLFEGGIFGAVGDIKKEPKKMVLDRILNNIGESSNTIIATFGDGPVEIRETHKRGGVTIGVAGNELKRFGFNRTKRTRLIKAGADIIVPDFSQSAELLSLLNISWV